MSAVTVIDQALAHHLDRLPDGVVVIPRDRMPWWRPARATRWRPLQLERVIDVLCGLRDRGIVLARPAAIDPGAALLPRVAILAGHEVLSLPLALDEAVWCVGVVSALGGSAVDTRGRILDVVCCGPAGVTALPRQTWGPAGLGVPAVRPATLARWAYCAWRACSWCDGGGLPGRRCRRCGAPVADLRTAEAA